LVLEVRDAAFQAPNVRRTRVRSKKNNGTARGIRPAGGPDDAAADDPARRLRRGTMRNTSFAAVCDAARARTPGLSARATDRKTEPRFWLQVTPVRPPDGGLDCPRRSGRHRPRIVPHFTIMKKLRLDISRPGFTLIEILVVVVILGILAAVVIAQVNNVTEDSEKAAFITSGRTFAEAAMRFHLDHGAYPNDMSPGELPPGFADYFNYNAWLAPTPIGGRWDAELNEDGIISAVGVVFDGTDNKSDQYMREIDRSIDDGNLATGFFRKFNANRYFFIVDD
jgi:prepilin-type N-terminal cleavage/methylation domain-containing protein